MKVLLVGSNFHPLIGGVELHMKNLAIELLKRGFDVQVITRCKDFRGNRLPKVEEIEGIQVRRVSSPLQLFKKLRDYDGDIIHFHFYRDVFVAIGILAGKYIGKPLVLTPHVVYPSQSKSKQFIKWVYDLVLGRLTLSAIDRIISLTEDDREDILKLGAKPEKMRMVPNCIRLENFAHPESPELFREKFGVDDFVLFVGRVYWVKGLEYLIRAMPKVRELGLKLVIIGEDGGDRSRLQKLAEELNVQQDIVFTGYVTDKELHSAYAACTLFILPSFYEGLPTVILEAMAYSRPVIASRAGGTQYLIEDGHNGFLFDYGAPDAIYDKIKEAMESDLISVGQNGRRTVEETYAWERRADDIVKIYEEC